MRKYSRFITALAVAAMLCSCGGASDGQKPSGQAGSADSQQNSQDGTEQTSTEQADAEKAKAEAEKQLIEQLAQGAGSAGIRTDYSAYSSSSGNKDRFTRLREEWIPDLQEGTADTAIYPFNGIPIYGRSDSGYAWIVGYKMGFVDAKGRIVADPTYSDISSLVYTDPVSYQLVDTDYWLFSRTDLENMENPEDIFFEMDNVSYGVAKKDGSFVTECKYKDIYANEAGIMLVEDRKKGIFTMMDWQGKTCFTDKDISFRERLDPESFSYMNYGDGLYQVHLKDGEYYMDQEANLVMGPYYSASPFRDGLAVVQPIGPREYDESCGIIDKDGRWVVAPGKYSTIGSFNNGYAEAATDEDWEVRSYRLIDREGREVYDAGHKIINIYRDGYTVSDFYGEDSENRIFLDCDLNDISDRYQKGETECGSLELVSCTQDGTLTIRNARTDQKLEFSGDHYMHNISIGRGIESYADSRYFLVDRGEEDGGWYYDLYRTSDMKLIFEKVEFACLLPYGSKGQNNQNNQNDLNNQNDQVMLVIGRSNNRQEIYDENLKMVGRFRGNAELYGEQIAITGTDSFRYYDKNGIEWFHYTFRTNDD